MKLGEIFPNESVSTTQGDLKIHDYFGDGWGIFFTHPADYTPVCTTELSMVQKMVPEFTKRNVKMIALSCNSVSDHGGWCEDIKAHGNLEEVSFPIIEDPSRDLAVKFGMLDPDEKDAAGLPLTARAVFIVGPDKKLKLSILYPATTGRNFDELLRVIDSLQLTAYKKVATPANWQAGGDCMVLPSVKGEEATKLFPKMRVEDVPSGKQYMRFTPQPE
ncbi:peroxiredoxin-6-like [Bolinopsis microptera]|uniref:peroxiredoxin-6-like n=1 Tax=Bolinopsis microptera TaxID=2820187 RepID=UPI003078E4BB